MRATGTVFQKHTEEPKRGKLQEQQPPATQGHSGSPGLGPGFQHLSQSPRKRAPCCSSEENTWQGQEVKSRWLCPTLHTRWQERPWFQTGDRGRSLDLGDHSFNCQRGSRHPPERWILRGGPLPQGLAWCWGPQMLIFPLLPQHVLPTGGIAAATIHAQGRGCPGGSLGCPEYALDSLGPGELFVLDCFLKWLAHLPDPRPQSSPALPCPVTFDLLPLAQGDLPLRLGLVGLHGHEGASRYG